MTKLSEGPLSGYRVLELGSTIAGPFCGRLFADFGAEVIKIEPREGDGVRSGGARYKGKSLYAASILRNKKLVSLDLRHSKGQEIVKKLVSKCDIVIENFRPGRLEKWGLGYEDLLRVRPDLIMVRISGFGQTGPLSSRPGYGVICEAASGLRHLTGDPDRPPARVATALTDYITGLYAAFGAVMAIVYRARTGKGQCVDAALAEGALSFTEPHVPAYEKLGLIANRMGSALAGSAPNNLYPTKDGQYVHIQAAQNSVFKRFARAIGQEELLTDTKFENAVERGKHQIEVDCIVTLWTMKYSVAEIQTIMDKADIPAMQVKNVADVFNDPQFQAREMLVDVPDDELGTVKLIGPVPKLSESPGHINKSGGQVGADTKEVLLDIASISEAELLDLVSEGIVFCNTKIH
jgi:crotonobetainyl-CoA:carnitine CoA-transferase CaiB-like acyl-CoA transferase